MLNRALHTVHISSGLNVPHVLLQAVDLLPSDLEALLQLLLAPSSSEAASASDTELHAWREHVRGAAEGAVAAAEASAGVEGLAEATLASAQAVLAAVQGFSAQASFFPSISAPA